LDYAFNNAGIEGEQATTADYPVSEWERLISINLTGVWLSMKYEIPQMLKNGSGAIVNMSSILGTVGFANACAYVTAKHGVIGLTKTAALEYATQGIRVNAVCPAFIETPMLERWGLLTDPEIRAQLVSLHPLQRLGEPEEVADVVLWLCSEEASFVTGHAMLIDGGYVAQ
jgi:NAD(P)-dependent dehydrogenase (short-subunit alcohol dehydrogenase family)